VWLLLEKGADVKAKGEDGWTALMRAAKGRYKAVVQLLLEKGADVKAEDKWGSTVLNKAARCRHKAVVRLLLEKGRTLRPRADGGGRRYSR
jgi:ankyrin repeat domain-containing protein 50